MKNRHSKYSGPIAWMAENSVAANLLMLLFLFGGFISLCNIGKEVNPVWELDIIEIYVEYPGASPEEIEKGVILAIEESLQGIEDINKISSKAYDGFGVVWAEANESANLNKLSQDIKNKVDSITTLPSETERPIVNEYQRESKVILFALYGDVDIWNLRLVAERVKNELLEYPQINRVELDGIRKYEVSIEIPSENLRRYNLTLERVAEIIKASNVELPGGGLKASSGEVLVRVSERKEFARFCRHLF